MAKFDHFELLREMIDNKFVNVRKHPTFPLWIYNYSKRVQRKDVWNEVTNACRGLILDEEFNVVSRPFRRFLNHDEISPVDIPKESFAVTEKMDGSLGISYFYEGIWYIATRGSFDSRHALRANQILHQKYADCLKKMKPEYTYLFEVLYPENRIIVDYGNREELVLLAVINTATGQEVNDDAELSFTKLKIIEGFNSLDDVLKLNDDHSEGVVVRFANGSRLKVKFEKYKRQHRIMLSLTDTKIWKYLAFGRDFEKLYNYAGEEFYGWINETKEELLSAYNTLKEEVMKEFNTLPPFNSHEEAIDYLAEKEHAELLCSLFNNEPIEPLLWQKIKPDENASWFAERG